MSIQPPFNPATVESISKILGEAGSGSDIERYLKICHLQDNYGESTKWRRLNAIFLNALSSTNSPNQILNFIKSYLAPTRFSGNSDEFNTICAKLNQILIMHSLEYRADGEFHYTSKAKTLSEAEARVQGIIKELRTRKAHEEIYKYCKPELMDKNYFHAVFEASKSLFQRIRDLSGIEEDGAALIDKAFSINDPYLVFNSLQTETEKSEHKGFALLLKGCGGAVRNPRAHQPKILSNGEKDALDCLTLISLLHRKLDECTKVPQSTRGEEK